MLVGTDVVQYNKIIPSNWRYPTCHFCKKLSHMKCGERDSRKIMHGVWRCTTCKLDMNKTEDQNGDAQPDLASLADIVTRDNNLHNFDVMTKIKSAKGLRTVRIKYVAYCLK